MPTTTKERLNLGCGEKKMADAVNVDMNETVRADVVHDLNKTPYPFAANTFKQAYAYHVMEHLDDLTAVMGELFRILKPGGTITIVSPHFSYVNAYQDPTHRHYFAIGTFDYFCEQNQFQFYTEGKMRFEVVSRRIVFQPGLWKPIFESLFNRHIHFYETKLAWIFPAERVEIVLRAAK